MTIMSKVTWWMPILHKPSQKVCFSRTGFVYVKNWKNSENSSISQLCFLSVIYLRFIITLVKGMFDTFDQTLFEYCNNSTA
jgi:hypothetical protein